MIKKRPFTHVPLDTVKHGPKNTQIYIDKLLQSDEIVYRRKICIVGPSNWGKTSLAKSVTTSTPSLEHPDSRTIGIDQWTLRIELPSFDDNKIVIYEVTFWDFAGQDAYQVAHSLIFFVPHVVSSLRGSPVVRRSTRASRTHS